MPFLRFAQFNLISLLLASQTAFAGSNLNLPLGVTPISQAIYHLHMTILWICIIIGVLVFGTMFYAIIFHRKSRGAKAAKFHEHLWVELAWTIIPSIILIGMAIPTTRVLMDMADVGKPDITIKITGYQWKWKYEYLDQGITFFSNNATPFDQMHGKAPKDTNYLRVVDHPLVLPIHQKVRFLVTSNDVIHSWWVPDLGVKRDAIPGYINQSWARINRAGTYHGQCAELCGINHAYMPVVVVTLPKQDFDNWVAQQKGLAVAPVATPTPAAAGVAGTNKLPTTTPAATSPATAPAAAAAPAAPATPKLADLMQQGEKIFLSTCAVCHQPNGMGMPPTFPALKGDKIVTGSREDHIKTVLNGKPGTAMQAFKEQLSDADLAAVITYERNAWGNNTGDIIQVDEIKKMREAK